MTPTEAEQEIVRLTKKVVELESVLNLATLALTPFVLRSSASGKIKMTTKAFSNAERASRAAHDWMNQNPREQSHTTTPGTRPHNQN